MLTDTHCHLDFYQFDVDRLEIIESAKREYIFRILNPGISLESSLKAVNLASRYEVVYAAIGIHPNNALSWTEDTATQLEVLAQKDKVIAIGEIGLDYFHQTAPREKQIRILEEQLSLASKINLPVIIHTRNKNTEDNSAIIDTLDILDVWLGGMNPDKTRLKENPGVLHSFSSDYVFASKAAHSNFAIGVTGPITYKNNEPIRTVVQNIALRNILIETDAPFLTPHPYRGKRNEPAFVHFVADKIAEIRQMSYDQVSMVTTDNAKRIFDW